MTPIQSHATNLYASAVNCSFSFLCLLCASVVNCSFSFLRVLCASAVNCSFSFLCVLCVSVVKLPFSFPRVFCASVVKNSLSSSLHFQRQLPCDPPNPQTRQTYGSHSRRLCNFSGSSRPSPQPFVSFRRLFPRFPVGIAAVNVQKTP